jgi:hypothetical protein
MLCSSFNLEGYELHNEASTMDDAALVDEIAYINSAHELPGDVEAILVAYYEDGKLTPEDRTSLICTYILTYAMFIPKV